MKWHFALIPTESIRNWITEILGATPNPQYVDVGVQTNTTSVWDTVKQWFLEVCSVRSSQLSSLGQNGVDKWRNKLDSIQSVSLHNSESPLTSLAFGSPDSLQNLLGPDDSASNISEVVSENALQDVVEPQATASNVIARVYDINDPEVLTNLLEDPSVNKVSDIT